MSYLLSYLFKNSSKLCPYSIASFTDSNLVLLWLLDKELTNQVNTTPSYPLHIYFGRRASIGVTLDAFQAGRSPAMILSPTEIIHTLIISVGR